MIEEKEALGGLLGRSLSDLAAIPKMLENWPTNAVLEVRYQLAGRTLTMTITVNNPTAGELPYGFGIHPYFRLPLAAGGDPEKTQVILPAAKSGSSNSSFPPGKNARWRPGSTSAKANRGRV